MAELGVSEKLQPCLLDRLTDDDPKNSQESRNERVVSLQRYKRGVMRDLEWLFNASAHLPDEGEFSLADYPEAHRSVINYGIRQLFGLIAPNMAELEQELTQAILTFEPRILRKTLTVKSSQVNNRVIIEIEGELWANPMPEHLHINTQVDLEAAGCVLNT